MLIDEFITDAYGSAVGVINPKAKYKVTNWKKYEERLKNRGDICFWFSEDVFQQWYHQGGIKTVGRQFKYSNIAIKTGLILKILFKLPYRALEGFLTSICKMMDLQLEIPDHTVFSRRSDSIKDLELTKLKKLLKMRVIKTLLKNKQETYQNKLTRRKKMQKFFIMK